MLVIILAAKWLVPQPAITTFACHFFISSSSMPLMLVMFRALALAEDTQEAMVMLETEAEEDSSAGLVVGSVLGAITMVLFSLLGDFKNSFGQKG